MAYNDVARDDYGQIPVPAYISDSIKRKRELERAIRDRHKAKEYDWSCGRVCVELGVTLSALLMKTTKSKVKYWQSRVLDPSLHNGTLGGARHRFDDEKERAVLTALQESVVTDPTRPVSFICSHILQTTGHSVSPTYVKDAIAAADWRYVKFCLSGLGRTKMLTVHA